MASWPNATSWPATRSWPGTVSFPSGTAFPASEEDFARAIMSQPVGVNIDATGLNHFQYARAIMSQTVDVVIAATSAATGDPSTIVTSKTLQLWLRADQGITIATGVSAWNDITVNARNFAQATGGSQPTFSAAGGPNATPYVSGNGSSNTMTSSYVPPVPGTTPNFFWGVMRPRTFAAGGAIVGGNASTRRVLGFGAASPNLRGNNGAARDLAITLNVWGRFEWSLANSVAIDRLKFAANALAVGTAFGNNAISAGALALFALNTGASFGAFDLAELCVWHGEPTGTELTNLDAYVTSRYGAGLV